MAKKQPVPVFLFTGFLEGGKTYAIQRNLQDAQFNTGDKIVVISCEEGIEELDPTSFASPNVYLETVEDVGALTPSYFEKLRKKHDMACVILEYNGMWPLDELYNALPEDFPVYQEIMCADAGTFLTYNANMRQMMMDKLQSAELVLLRGADETTDRQTIHQIVRGGSRKAIVAYYKPDGSVEPDGIEDPLPYDLDADIVEIKDKDFAVWFRDMIEETDKYDGKTVSVKAMTLQDKQLEQNTFVFGRPVMQCCEADTRFWGLLCVSPLFVPVKDRGWMQIKAKIKIEPCKLYNGGPGPVLHIISTSVAEPLENPVATFFDM